MSDTPPNHFDLLPDEMLAIEVFGYFVVATDLLAVSAVCKRFNACSNDDVLWKRVCTRSGLQLDRMVTITNSKTLCFYKQIFPLSFSQPKHAHKKPFSLSLFTPKKHTTLLAFLSFFTTKKHPQKANMQSQVEVIYISSEEDDAWKYVLTPTCGLSDSEIMEDQVEGNTFMEAVKIELQAANVPAYPSTERAAIAASKLIDYYQHRKQES